MPFRKFEVLKMYDQKSDGNPQELFLAGCLSCDQEMVSLAASRLLPHEFVLPLLSDYFPHPIVCVLISQSQKVSKRLDMLEFLLNQSWSKKMGSSDQMWKHLCTWAITIDRNSRLRFSRIISDSSIEKPGWPFEDILYQLSS